MPTSSNVQAVCIQCKAFCCTKVKPPITEQEKRKILESGYKDYFHKIDKGVYTITSGSDKKCPYLKSDYTCQIHKVKPKLCQLWPIIPHYKKNKRGCLVIKCPIYPLLTEEEIQKAKKEANTIPINIINHLWNVSPETKQEYKKFEYEEI